MWFLPIALIVFTLIVAIPMSKYIAWIMDGKYGSPLFSVGNLVRRVRPA